MLTIKLRKTQTIMLAAAALAGVLLFVGLSAGIKENYRQSVLLEGDWGAGPGRFGGSGAPAGSALLRFCLDERGGIYIADNGNGRIDSFSRQGKWRAAIAAGGSVGSLAAGEAGSLWFSDPLADKLTGLAPGGEQKYSQPLLETSGEAPEIYTVEDLQSGEQDNVYVQEATLYRHSVNYRLRKLDWRSGAWTVISEMTVESGGGVKTGGIYPSERKVNSFFVDRYANLYLESRAGERVRRVERVDRQGEKTANLLLVLPGTEKIRQTAIVGVDRKGRVYLACNPGTPDGKLYRFSGGKLEVPLTPELLAALPPENRGVRVDRRGNIYVLQAGPSGLQLVKYTLQARLGFRS